MSIDKHLEDPGRRRFLGLMGKVASLAAAYPIVSAAESMLGGNNAEAAEYSNLPEDKYNPKGPEVSEDNFKETLKGEGLVWVMYDWTGAKDSDKKLGDNFWKALKRAYVGQVDGFIRINTDDWSKYGEKATQEITRNAYPSFCLYRKGSVVNDGKPIDIRIRGPPRQDQIEAMLKYISKNSVLNHKLY